jgi:hypothetical protein
LLISFYISMTLGIFSPQIITFHISLLLLLGYAVAQLAEALSYKPERGGFNSRWRPSSRNMKLGSTQPLTDMNNRNISFGVKEAGA